MSRLPIVAGGHIGEWRVHGVWAIATKGIMTEDDPKFKGGLEHPAALSVNLCNGGFLYG